MLGHRFVGGVVSMRGMTIVVQDANYPARLHPNFDSGDGIHMRPRGNDRTMTVVTLKRLP